MTSSTTTPDAKRIFFAALDTPEAERPVFLDEACGGDVALRARVESLLRSQAESAGFLSGPITETPDEVRTITGAHVGYFGDYVLLDEIARGASGTVFRARQSSLGRTVALKLLDEQTPGSDAAHRFRAEAQTAAALDHPNIVPIYEVGEHEGRSYLSMKFIEGGTLAGHMAQFRADPESAARLMVKVARAVEAAHACGLLHRDIKPGNILISSAGEPLVTDFGIARRIGQDSELTQLGQVIGTPYYMAPEQARGETRTLTPQADVYALGAVLYEMLGGRRPFEGEGMIEVLRRVVDEAPKSLRTLNPAVPRELEIIVGKCMEKTPAARYSTAAGMADDLERWLRGEPIAARPAGVVLRFVKWVRRSPAKAALIFLTATLLASWAGFANWAASQPAPATAVAPALTPPQTEPALAEAGEESLPMEPEDNAGMGLNLVKSAVGRTVDILRLIEITKPQVQELWRDDGTALVGFRSSDRRIGLILPMRAAADYDYRVEFTLSEVDYRSGREVSLLSVPVGKKSAQIVLGSSSGCSCFPCDFTFTGKRTATPKEITHPFGPVSGLRQVAGKPLVENGTGVLNHKLAAGPHTLDVRVRLLKNDTASLTVLLDGKPFIAWQGATKDLPESANDGGSSQQKRLYTFSAWNPARYVIRYTRMTLTPLTGDAWIRLPVVKK